MNTQKVAITMPGDLLEIIDDMSKKLGISRSAYILALLREKVMEEKDREIKQAYDEVFSDESIQREQLETTKWFEGTGSKEGQEW